MKQVWDPVFTMQEISITTKTTFVLYHRWLNGSGMGAERRKFLKHALDNLSARGGPLRWRLDDSCGLTMLAKRRGPFLLGTRDLGPNSEVPLSEIGGSRGTVEYKYFDYGIGLLSFSVEHGMHNDLEAAGVMRRLHLHQAAIDSLHFNGNHQTLDPIFGGGFVDALNTVLTHGFDEALAERHTPSPLSGGEGYVIGTTYSDEMFLICNAEDVNQVANELIESTGGDVVKTFGFDGPVCAKLDFSASTFVVSGPRDQEMCRGLTEFLIATSVSVLDCAAQSQLSHASSFLGSEPKIEGVSNEVGRLRGTNRVDP